MGLPFLLFPQPQPTQSTLPLLHCMGPPLLHSYFPLIFEALKTNAILVLLIFETFKTIHDYMVFYFPLPMITSRSHKNVREHVTPPHDYKWATCLCVPPPYDYKWAMCECMHAYMCSDS